MGRDDPSRVDALVRSIVLAPRRGPLSARFREWTGRQRVRRGDASAAGGHAAAKPAPPRCPGACGAARPAERDQLEPVRKSTDLKGESRRGPAPAPARRKTELVVTSLTRPTRGGSFCDAGDGRVRAARRPGDSGATVRGGALRRRTRALQSPPSAIRHVPRQGSRPTPAGYGRPAEPGEKYCRR